MSGVVFVGCKTTGLDPDRHEIRQLALIVDHEAHAWTIGAGGDPWRYAAEAWYLTSNRTLVGVDPAFDVAFLTKFLRRRGYEPKWRHHVIDVKALAEGWLRGRHPKVPGTDPPWSTDDLARGLHLSPEDFGATALGDARLAKAMYEAVMAP